MRILIDVKRFARPITGTQSDLYPFGLATPQGIAAELRRFADDVESGAVFVLKVQCAQVAAPDDYAISCLFVEFVELIKPEQASEKSVVGFVT
jgi:hypothetical protein